MIRTDQLSIRVVLFIGFILSVGMNARTEIDPRAIAIIEEAKAAVAQAKTVSFSTEVHLLERSYQANRRESYEATTEAYRKNGIEILKYDVDFEEPNFLSVVPEGDSTHETLKSDGASFYSHIGLFPKHTKFEAPSSRETLYSSLGDAAFLNLDVEDAGISAFAPQHFDELTSGASSVQLLANYNDYVHVIKVIYKLRFVINDGRIFEVDMLDSGIHVLDFIRFGVHEVHHEHSFSATNPPYLLETKARELVNTGIYDSAGPSPRYEAITKFFNWTLDGEIDPSLFVYHPRNDSYELSSFEEFKELLLLSPDDYEKLEERLQFKSNLSTPPSLERK